MDIPVKGAVERIARVLAGHNLSANADGDDSSAGHAVDDLWPDYVNNAIGVLRTLREPDQRMAAAGDVETWSRMIDAALAGEDQ